MDLCGLFQDRTIHVRRMAGNQSINPSGPATEANGESSESASVPGSCGAKTVDGACSSSSLPSSSGQAAFILKGHADAVTCIAWEPLHLCCLKNGTMSAGQTELEEQCVSRLVSGSKDRSVRVWDVVRRTTLISLCSHTLPITSLVWSGEDGGQCSAPVINKKGRMGNDGRD